MKNDRTSYIFDIQRFSIHDGPGIRTVLFTKGCPLYCKWCQNPESQKILPEVAYYAEKCKHCNKCVVACPENAIDPVTKISDHLTCIACGQCIDICENDARRMIGKKYENHEIIEELLKDIDFYFDSGGGITFSGGEPFMHTDFLSDILKELKKNNIHINIETCGQFNFEKVEKILPYIDMIYFDIKLMNHEQHKKYTGIGNNTILANFKKLNRVFNNIQVRIPLVPGVNDDNAFIEQVCDFLLKNGHSEVYLLPYHSMGNSKAIRIDHQSEIFKAEPHTKEQINKIRSYFNESGVNTLTYD